MTSDEKIQEFDRAFSALIASAITKGVPLWHLANALAECEFECRHRNRIQMQMEMARDMSHKIVSAPAGLKLPPSPGGN